jgi:cytidine deaminase
MDQGTPILLPTLLTQAEQAARQAATYSYSPYSKFAVGATVVAEDGTLFSGCNVENSSYGLSICAERNAIFCAVAAGYRRFLAVVVYTPTQHATTPCGACRQVISEFAATPTMTILCLCDTDHRREMPLDAMLPFAFGPENVSLNR